MSCCGLLPGTRDGSPCWLPTPAQLSRRFREGSGTLCSPGHPHLAAGQRQSQFPWGEADRTAGVPERALLSPRSMYTQAAPSSPRLVFHGGLRVRWGHFYVSLNQLKASVF